MINAEGISPIDLNPEICTRAPRVTLAVGSALLVLAVHPALGQIGAMAFGALVGWRLFPSTAKQWDETLEFTINRRVVIGALVTFAVPLVGLPIAAQNGSHLVELFNAFY